jgi:hypothetical protein
MSRAGIAFVLIVFLCVFACQKNNLSTSESAFTSSSSNDTLLIDSQLIHLLYGDSIFSASVTGNEKKVFPVSKPSEPGYFAASLPGLDLDSATGRINISKSESGLRYQVYYLSFTNVPIDSAAITVSGIDYQDRVYDVASGAPEEQVAVPIYDMNPNLPMPCSNGSNGQGCKFDVTDLNNDSVADITGANNSKLVIDTITGIINLKKSLDNGVFGQPPLGNPMAMNGRKKDVTIYYSMGDGATRTLNKITVRLVYYQSRAMIPESMTLEINSRNQRYQTNALSANSGSADYSLTSLLYYTTTTLKPKRPPLIVIVSGR